MSSPSHPCNPEKPDRRPPERDARGLLEGPNQMQNRFLRQKGELPRAAKAAGRGGGSSFHSRFFARISAILTRIQPGRSSGSSLKRIRRPEAQLFPRRSCVILREFLNFDELVLVHMSEALARVGGGPPDFQSHNFRRLPQTDMLLDRIGSEGTSTADGAVNRTRLLPLVLDGHLDARPDSRAV